MDRKKQLVQDVKDPKTAAGNRLIDMTRGAYEALQRQLERTGTEGQHVFIDERYGAPWDGVRTLQKRWEIILRRAGVRYRNPYQTRHTFASVHLAAGRPPLQVARWMGHETTEMVERTYGRWIEQGQNPETRAALEAFFSHPAPTAGKVVAIAGARS
jgi:integrase